MRAVVFERAGPAEQVLALRDMTIPAAGAGEVIVKVLARCIQPADLMFIAGRYRVQPRFPQVAGFDGAGVVAEVGEGVEGLAPGRRVAFRSPGAWAEFTAVPAARLRPVPANLSATLPDELACQFPLNPPTAWGLLDMARPVRGARILATAGRSSVVRILAALARRRGLELQRLAREGGGYALLGAGATSPSRAAQPSPKRWTVNPASTSCWTRWVGRRRSILMAAACAGRPIDLVRRSRRPSLRVPRSHRAVSQPPLARLRHRRLDRRQFARNPRRRHAECWSLLASEPELLPVAARFGLEDFRLALDTQRQGDPAGKVVLV